MRLLDGAMGTELLARGLSLAEECPEAWNLTRPDQVSAVAAAYFAAGADAVQTNTFGANRVRLGDYALAGKVRAINVAAGLLAREVRPAGRRILGSMGPTGTNPLPADLEDVFAEQAAALAEAGVDGLHLETMYVPDEARAALRGARLGAPGLAVAISFTLRADLTTPAGFSLDDMLRELGEVSALGVNCTLSPTEMAPVVRALRARTTLPIFARPVSARPAAEVLALLDAGATSVGGCCGTTPADIAAIRAALR